MAEERRPPPERRNLYRQLHVQPEAPAEIIKSSYRTLMSTLKAHPDLGGDSQTAARLNAAYAVLTDPDTRRDYDRSLQPPPRRGDVATVLAAADPAAWLADRVCPFCRAPLPGAVHHDTRCVGCQSPLQRRPDAARSELLGRRGNPRNPRALPATLRLPGVAADQPARLRDLSVSGLCLQSLHPAAERSAMRIITAQFDAVAVVVRARRQGASWLLHGELLTLQLLRSQGVFVSAQA